jgi:hypothetical protein
MGTMINGVYHTEDAVSATDPDGAWVAQTVKFDIYNQGYFSPSEKRNP